MKRFVSSLAALILVAGSFGCSSFHREWKETVGREATWKGMEGPWEGLWQSAKNGHSGQLRCVVTRQTNDLYSARFHAKYKRLFNLSFGYTAQLRATTDDWRFEFTGQADLGWYAGGVYDYRGHATPTNFSSSYSCKYDHGNFFMTRPPQPSRSSE